MPSESRCSGLRHRWLPALLFLVPYAKHKEDLHPEVSIFHFSAIETLDSLLNQIIPAPFHGTPKSSITYLKVAPI